MCAFGVWRVLSVLCYVGTPLCANAADFEVNYMYNYDNEITQDQLEGESPATPCQAAEFSRWDKLFISLEDSHMKQNMLLESLEQCCGGVASLKAQVETLAEGACQQCLPSLETACRGQAEQASLRLQRGLAELGEEGAERERRMNSTFHQLLHVSREQNARLKKLEEGGIHREEAAAGGGPITPRPGGSGEGLGLGVKSSGSKEQEVTSQLDAAKVERALVAITTELQKVQVQLSRLVERLG
ncbi:pentraxin-related protein PTX3-like [Polymixia lowei]